MMNHMQTRTRAGETLGMKSNPVAAMTMSIFKTSTLNKGAGHADASLFLVMGLRSQSEMDCSSKHSGNE